MGWTSRSFSSDARVCGQLPLGGLLPGLEPQLVVEDRPQLRGRVQVELLPGVLEHLRLEGRHPVADRLPHLLEVRHVQPHAPGLHPGEDRSERQLHLLEEMPEALAIDLLLEDGRQEGHRGGLGGDPSPGILGEELTLGFLFLVAEEVGAQVALRERRERIVRRPRVQEVAGEHRVERHALEESAGSEGDPFERLRVVGPLRGRGVGESFADRPGAVERGVGGLRPACGNPEADQLVGLLVDRDADGALPEQAGELGRCHLSEVELGHVDLGFRFLRQLHQPVEQAPELERDEQPTDLLDVPLTHLRVLGFHVEGNVGHDPREVLVEDESLARRLDVLLQLPLQLVGSSEQLLDGAEVLDEFGRGLVPHARHAGDVVRRVAFQGHELEVLRRRHPVALLDRGLVHQRDVGDPPAVEQDADARPDELEEVPVGGHDRRLDPSLGRLDGEGADRIIRFVVRDPEHPDAERLHDFLDQAQLWLEVFGSLSSSRLVVGIHRQPGYRLAHVEGHGDEIRMLLGEELDQHRGEAVDRVGHLAGGSRERAGKCEERSVREGVSVQDEQPTGRVGRCVGGGGRRHVAYRSGAVGRARRSAPVPSLRPPDGSGTTRIRHGSTS